MGTDVLSRRETGMARKGEMKVMSCARGCFERFPSRVVHFDVRLGLVKGRRGGDAGFGVDGGDAGMGECDDDDADRYVG